MTVRDMAAVLVKEFVLYYVDAAGHTPQITYSTRLYEDLYVDEYCIVMLLLDIEDELGILIPGSKSGLIETFGDLVDLVMETARESNSKAKKGQDC